MKSWLLGATAAVALAAAAPTLAVAAAPSITYVPGSIAESMITSGPWTLHESAFTRDASGIIPPSSQTAPPYVGTGVPYRGFCGQPGQFNVNSGTSVMQPFYFPFVRQNGNVLEGFFDYRPRNEQEALVTATSSDLGKTWTFTGEALAQLAHSDSDIAERIT